MTCSIYIAYLRRFLQSSELESCEKYVPSRISPSYLRALRDNPFPTSKADTAISGTLQTREYYSSHPGRSPAGSLSSARERLRRHKGLLNDVPSPGERQLDFTNYGVWESEPPKEEKKGGKKGSSLLGVVSSDDEVEAATGTGDDNDDDDDEDRCIAWVAEQQRDNDSDEAVYWTSDSSDRDTESENETEDNESTELTDPCLNGAEEQVPPAAVQQGQSISSSPDGGSLDLGSFAGEGAPGGVRGDLLEAQESDEAERDGGRSDSGYGEKIKTLKRGMRKGGWADDDV